MISFSIFYHRLFGKAIIVYNIQVEDCPEFYANNILVHNCNVCRSMNGKTIAIADSFESNIFNSKGDIVSSFDVAFPPVHPRCRCWIQYEYKEAYCDNFLRKDFIKEYTFYDSTKEADNNSCVNPDSVWNGGDVKVGPDSKMLDTYYNDLQDKKDLQDVWKQETWKKLDTLSKDIEEVLFRSNNSNVLTDVKALRAEAERLGVFSIRPFGNTELELGMARADLSDSSFTQLLKNLNISDISKEKYGLSNVISLNKANELVSDSAFKTTLFHGTGADSFSSIYQSNKFLIGDTGSNGMGVYFTPAYTEAKAFGEEIVKAKINIDKIKTFKDSDDLVSYYLKGVEQDDSIISMPYSTAITKLVKNEGYNALQLEDSGWVTVFDPDKIILFK